MCVETHRRAVWAAETLSSLLYPPPPSPAPKKATLQPFHPQLAPFSGIIVIREVLHRGEGRAALVSGLEWMRVAKVRQQSCCAAEQLMCLYDLRAWLQLHGSTRVQKAACLQTSSSSSSLHLFSWLRFSSPPNYNFVPFILGRKENSILLIGTERFVPFFSFRAQTSCDEQRIYYV